MRILTLDSEDFATACRELHRKVRNSGFEFDTLVGIATGGDYVAEAFGFSNTLSVRRQRSLTVSKEGKIGKILCLLPLWLSNLLRVAESFAREASDHFFPPHAENLHLPDEVATKIKKSQKILVVDDAVDSGATAAAVVNSIKAEMPEADVRLAVITVTRPNPILKPDYALFNNRTLVRFPWSHDVRRQ